MKKVEKYYIETPSLESLKQFLSEKGYSRELTILTRTVNQIYQEAKSEKTEDISRIWTSLKEKKKDPLWFAWVVQKLVCCGLAIPKSQKRFQGYRLNRNIENTVNINYASITNNRFRQNFLDWPYFKAMLFSQFKNISSKKSHYAGHCPPFRECDFNYFLAREFSYCANRDIMRSAINSFKDMRVIMPVEDGFLTITTKGLETL